MRLHLLGSILIALVVVPVTLDAQPGKGDAKPAIGTDDPGLKAAAGSRWKIDWKDANPKTDFRPGKMLQFTLEGAEIREVRGLVVGLSKKNDKTYLLVREQSTVSPTAILLDEIKEPKVAIAYKVSAKDGVRDVAAGDITNFPDIQKIVIFNGTKRTVSYFSTSLSPGETDQLTLLETAENDLARAEHAAALQTRILENDVAIQEGLRLTQTLQNENIYKQDSIPAYVQRQVPPVISPDLFVRVGPSVMPQVPGAPENLIRARVNYISVRDQVVSQEGRLVVLTLLR